MKSKLMRQIQRSENLKNSEYNALANIIVDLCFVTSYKIEDLLRMPPSRLNLLVERFMLHFSKERGKK